MPELTNFTIEKIKQAYGEACRDYWQGGKDPVDLGRVEAYGYALMCFGMTNEELYGLKMKELGLTEDP